MYGYGEVRATHAATCSLYIIPFDIRLIANQTVNNSGRAYLFQRFVECIYKGLVNSALLLLASTHTNKCKELHVLSQPLPAAQAKDLTFPTPHKQAHALIVYGARPFLSFLGSWGQAVAQLQLSVSERNWSSSID